MIWRNIETNGRTLIHIQQEDNTNQCVAASVGMIAENAGYWGRNENALFSYGASAMKKHNQGQFNGQSDRQLINANGIRPNAIASYLLSYGWKVQSLVANDANSAAALAGRINTMQNYDSCILACGVDAFHALAAIRLGGVTYILNPAYNPEENREHALHTYHANPVGHNEANVAFNDDDDGNGYFRSVNACHFIPSQYKIGTAMRWLYRSSGG